MSKRLNAFNEDVAAKARQLSDYTDIRLQSPQEIGLMLGVSEYTRKYLGEYLTNYEKLKVSSFVNGINGIASSQSHAIVVTKYTDNYVILNNRTGNLDFFRSEFFMTEELLNTIISRFNEDCSELVLVHTVKDFDQKNLYIIARQEC
ncbi:hypothetical protein QFZ77_001343 [Paenibacillus sp. V4I3]|uniref:hypothetical protein n=1 Tax=unclassified Paenibacillus TaxID=185978 RepID=UPI00278B8F23|nr:MULTISPECIES: hypothetical protein [unclassified Paenibacillus]MDQ0872684.1 hypothetical protein [Paenibacillus sp. V4I3]MDQ0891432.1 hypothetical protein [Paenibacillus sp. V4I9]